MLCCFISRMSAIIDSRADVVAGVRVVLVAVDALDQDRHAVDQELAVLDLRRAEADLGGQDLDDRTLAVLQGQQQGVEVGRLRPTTCAGLATSAPSSTTISAVRGDGGLGPRAVSTTGSPSASSSSASTRTGRLGSPKFRSQTVRSRRAVADSSSSRPVSTSKSRMSRSADREQEDVAEDAADAPEVLALEVGAVAVAIDLGGDACCRRARDTA